MNDNINENAKKLFTTLYENIGSKIKTFAKACFLVESIAAVIAGVIMIMTDEELIIYGLLTILLGPIVAWVSSWMLYGFGELVDKTCEIAENTKNAMNNPKE